MGEHKKSLLAGISSLAQAGALFAGEVADLDVVFHDQNVQRLTTGAEAGAEAGVDLVWDDEEERRYREWVKLKVQENDQPDFDEFRQEEAFRQKLRDETKSRKNDEVCWEDEREREWRAEYARWRGGGGVEWDTTGERQHQLRHRRDTELRRNTEVTWDDTEERACREMFRKKYGK